MRSNSITSQELILKLKNEEWYKEVSGRKIYPIWYENICSSYKESHDLFVQLFDIQTDFPAVYIIDEDVIKTVFWNTPMVEKTSQAILEKIMGDRKYLDKLTNEFESRYKETLAFCEWLKKTDFSQVSNQELYSNYEGINTAFRRIFVGAISPRLISRKGEIMLSDWLSERFDSKRSTELMSVLTSTLKDSFLGEEARDLLELGIKIENGSKLEELIQEHTESYGWIGFGFGGEEAYSPDYFIKEFEEVSKVPGSFWEKLMDLDAQKDELSSKKEDLIKELGFGQEMLNLIDTLSEMVFFKDHIREAEMKLLLCSKPLFDEIAKRLHKDNEFVMRMFSDEIKNAFVRKLIDTETISTKKELVIYTLSGDLSIFQDDEAKMIVGSLSSSDAEVTELQGSAASLGYAIGRAKIVITQEDFKKFEDGDILVATMTTPDFVPLMRKARAIVTDEGGITCHAAIVSRELGVPCVVGTSDATRVFKDGDQIEVKANHGIVRKIKQL